MNHGMKADKYEVSVNYKVTNERPYQSLMLERSLSSSPVRVPPKHPNYFPFFAHTNCHLEENCFFCSQIMKGWNDSFP